jgi:hypothetical protein
MRPSLEIDTEHRGFPSAEMAGLFANGLGAVGVQCLWLEEGVLELQLTDGRRAQVDPTDIRVWVKTAGAESLPGAASFERVDMTPQALSRDGSDGRFEAQAFRVVTTGEPERDVEVQLAVDLQRDVLRVAVVDPTPRRDRESRGEAPTLFGVVPKA